MNIHRIIGLLFCTSSAIAAGLPEPATSHGFYVGAGAAGMVFDDERQTENTFVPMANIGYQLNDRYAVEAGFGWIKTDREDLDRNVVGYTALMQLVGLWNVPSFFQQMKLVDWSKMHIVSYSGLGYTRLSPNGNISGLNPRGDEAVEQANLNGGLGLQYDVTDHLAVRLDARDTYILATYRADWLFGASLQYYY